MRGCPLAHNRGVIEVLGSPAHEGTPPQIVNRRPKIMAVPPSPRGPPPSYCAVNQYSAGSPTREGITPQAAAQSISTTRVPPSTRGRSPPTRLSHLRKPGPPPHEGMPPGRQATQGPTARFPRERGDPAGSRPPGCPMDHGPTQPLRFRAERPPATNVEGPERAGNPHSSLRQMLSPRLRQSLSIPENSKTK